MNSNLARIKATSSFSAQGARPGQEDFVIDSREKGIFVVADGFGGPIPGATAAKTACESVRGFLVKEAGDLDATLPFVLRSYFSLAGNVLFNAIIHANRKVLALNKGKGVHERGGTSLVAGFLDGDLLALGSIGGCSAWLFRDGRECELVTPRTYGRLVDPFGDVASGCDLPLTAMGICEDLEPEIVECRIREKDWLLFQTDGLTAEVRSKLLSLQSQGSAAEDAVQEIPRILSAASYADNSAATVVLF